MDVSFDGDATLDKSTCNVEKQANEIGLDRSLDRSINSECTTIVPSDVDLSVGNLTCKSTKTSKKKVKCNPHHDQDSSNKGEEGLHREKPVPPKKVSSLKRGFSQRKKMFRDVSPAESQKSVLESSSRVSSIYLYFE